MTAIVEADAAFYAERIKGWRYAEFAIEPYRWACMKYHFARFAWPRRNEFCSVKDENGKRMTWRMRFYEMFNEPLPQYVGRCKQAARKAA